MKIVRNRWIPGRKFIALNFFGLLLCRPDTHISISTINHERIHTAQMKELLFIGFYLWYFTEWLVRLCMRGNAYYNIGFEREAYRHMYEYDYLRHRRPYAWWYEMRRRRKRQSKHPDA